VVGGSTYAAVFDSDQDYTLGLSRSGTEEWWLKTYTDGRFAIHENGVGDKITIKAGGNVGIGTTSPGRQLELRGQGVVRLNAISGGDPGIDFNTSDVNDIQIRYRSTTDALAIYSYGTSSDVLTIKKSDGNVGIGTTSPSNKLDVRGLTRLNALSLRGGADNYAHLSRFSWRNTNSSSSGTTWKKVCGVSVGAGNYSAVSVDVVHYQPGSNHGNSASLKKRYYSISFRRSSGSQDNQDDAVVYGRDANFIRVVRTAVGEFELQARANVNNQSYSVDITQTGGNSDAIVIVENSSTNGNTTGTIYTAVSSANTTVELPGSLGAGSNVYLNHNGHSYLNGGNVGIGTTTPDAPLTVHSSTDPEIRFGYSSTQDHKIQWDSSKVFIHADPENANASSAIALYVDGGAKLYIPDSGNVGIGTTNPGSLLHVEGDRTTAALQINQTGTGVIANFKQGGSSKVIIDNSGNVGIGTTSPGAELHIYDSTLWAQIIVEAANDGYDSSVVYTQSGVTKGITGYDDSTDTVALKYGTFSGNGIDITAGGNVGIGTTSPAKKLEVRSLINTESSIRIRQASYNFWDLKIAASSVDFTINDVGGEKLKITSTGNVGIGTTSPVEKMHIQDNSGANIILNSATGAVKNGIYMTEGTTSTPKQVGAYVYYDGVSNKFNIATGVGVPTDKLTILRDSGNVGIGTTSPENKLHLLTSTTDATQQLLIQNGSTGDAAIKFNISGDTYSLGIDNSDSDKFKLSAGNLGTNDRLVIDSAGNVGIGTNNTFAKLSVRTTSPINGISINRAADTTAALYLGNDGGNTGIISSNNSPISFGRVIGTTYTERMRMTNAGDFGIGTTSPSEKLEVNGNVKADNFIGGKDAGIYTFSDTVDASSSQDIFSISCNHGAEAFRVTFVCSTSGYSVAKTFEVVHSYGNDPVFFKVVDTGVFSAHDFDVSFTNSNTDTGVTCEITNNSTTINADIVTTVFLGGSPTTTTVTAL